MADKSVWIVRRLRLHGVDVKLVGGALRYPSARRWRVDARLADFHIFQTPLVKVEIDLEDALTIAGDGMVTQTDGRSITLESIGRWSSSRRGGIV